MDIRRQSIRIIEGAHAYETHLETGPGIMTPHRYLAAGAAGDPLPFAAGRGCEDYFRITAKERNPTRLDHGIQGKRRAALALTPAAVAAMDEQRRGFHLVADLAAVTTAGERVNYLGRSQGRNL